MSVGLHSGVRSKLTDNGEFRCPHCKKLELSPDLLVPNKTLRARIERFIAQTARERVGTRAAATAAAAAAASPSLCCCCATAAAAATAAGFELGLGFSRLHLSCSGCEACAAVNGTRLDRSHACWRAAKGCGCAQCRGQARRWWDR